MSEWVSEPASSTHRPLIITADDFARALTHLWALYESGSKVGQTERGERWQKWNSIRRLIIHQTDRLLLLPLFPLVLAWRRYQLQRHCTKGTVTTTTTTTITTSRQSLHQQAALYNSGYKHRQREAPLLHFASLPPGEHWWQRETESQSGKERYLTAAAKTYRRFLLLLLWANHANVGRGRGKEEKDKTRKRRRRWKSRKEALFFAQRVKAMRPLYSAVSGTHSLSYTIEAADAAAAHTLLINVQLHCCCQTDRLRERLCDHRPTILHSN